MTCNPAAPCSWVGPLACCGACGKQEGSMRRAAKVDGNQAEIVNALRAVGAEVQDLSGVGQGVPDLMVAYRGRNYLIEIKRPKAKGQKAGALTDPQKKFFARWLGRGQAAVADTVDDALRVIGAMGGRVDC